MLIPKSKFRNFKASNFRLKRNPEKVRKKYRKKRPKGLKNNNDGKRRKIVRKSGNRKRFEDMNKVYKDLWKEVGSHVA